MSDLRIVQRNGEKVLQQLVVEYYKHEPYYGLMYHRKYKWVDVPTEEEKEYENEPDPLLGGM